MDKNLNKKEPLVSVLMIVKNAERYVAGAIESVQNQTYKNWEMIIVYDDSSDKTLFIIEEKAKKDGRIKVTKNPLPLGLLGSRNKALEVASGKYVATLDSDDIALPDRLSVQSKFLENNPDIAVAGSWLFVKNDIRGNTVTKNETGPNIVSAGLLFNTMLANSSTMIRKEFLDKYKISYDPEFPFAEDYALWVECAKHGKLTNIPEVLIIHRQHAESHTNKRRKEQSVDIPKLRKTVLLRLGLNPTEEEIEIHNATSAENGDKYIFAQKSLAWLQKIEKTNDKNAVYKKQALSYILEKRFYLICATNLNPKTFLLFLKNPFGKTADHIYKSLKMGVRLILRSL